MPAKKQGVSNSHKSSSSLEKEGVESTTTLDTTANNIETHHTPDIEETSCFTNPFSLFCNKVRSGVQYVGKLILELDARTAGSYDGPEVRPGNTT
jgi:hypothetical protein